MVNFRQLICGFLVGVSRLASGETEEWRNEHTLGVVALKSMNENGQGMYINATGNQNSRLITYHPHCSYTSERFQCILIKEGAILSSLKEENRKLKERIKKLEEIIGISNEG